MEMKNENLKTGATETINLSWARPTLSQHMRLCFSVAACQSSLYSMWVHVSPVCTQYGYMSVLSELNVGTCQYSMWDY